MTEHPDPEGVQLTGALEIAALLAVVAVLVGLSLVWLDVRERVEKLEGAVGRLVEEGR